MVGAYLSLLGIPSCAYIVVETAGRIEGESMWCPDPELYAREGFLGVNHTPKGQKKEESKKKVEERGEKMKN